MNSSTCCAVSSYRLVAEDPGVSTGQRYQTFRRQRVAQYARSVLDIAEQHMQGQYWGARSSYARSGLGSA
eukprot:3260292-Rhodomonas_salina.4